MNHVVFADILALGSYLLSLVFLYYGWNSFLRPDVRYLFLAILVLSIFHSFSNVLEWSGITSYLDHFEDYVEILMPLVWGMFFYWFIQDIMARELQVSQKRYELATTSGQIAVWEWDLSRDKFYVDSNLKLILGYERNDFFDRFRSWLDLIHPDDLVELRKRRAELNSGRMSQLESEIRLKHKRGDYRWFLVRGATIKDQRTWSWRFFGTIIDITDRKKAEDAVKGALSEKEVLLKEVHHRVKNNLQIISSLFDLQFEDAKDQRTQELIVKTQERIKAIAFIHEMLYHSRQLSAIDFAEYIEKITMSLFNLSDQSGKRIVIKNEVGHTFLDINLAILCGLIINELVTNAIKHAFKGRESGEIVIRLETAGLEGCYQLIVRDNGIGAHCDLNDPANHSLGLQLVNRFSEQLKAQHRFVYNQGMIFELIFGTSS